MVSNYKKSIAILVIHGIGVHHDESPKNENKQKDKKNFIFAKPDIVKKFEDKLIKPLEEKVKKELPQGYEGLKRELFDLYSKSNGSLNLVIEPVEWGKILQPHEDKLWEHFKKAGLKSSAIRKMIVTLLSDILAYQPLEGDDSIYNEIHKTIHIAINKLSKYVGPKTPLFIVAHSLGSVIASNFISDLQRNPPENGTPLEKGETLQALYTLGSPLALYSLREKVFDDIGTGKDRKHPLTMPVAIPKWINFYSPSDIISYPLEFLKETWPELNVKDVKVEVGNVFTSWNAASHLMYWTDPVILNQIINDIIEYENEF